MALQRAWLPKIRLAFWRRGFYRDAFAQARRRVPDLTMSDWVREACDRQAMEELDVKVMPVPDLVFADNA
jgi:hypothetical protein